MSSCAVHRCRRSYEIASANCFFLQYGGNCRSIWIDWLRVFLSSITSHASWRSALGCFRHTLKGKDVLEDLWEEDLHFDYLRLWARVFDFCKSDR